MAQNVIYWKFEDGTLDIRGDEAEGYTVWNIPDTYTRTDVPWNSMTSDIIEAIIQNNVEITNMSYWFMNCYYLNKSITIPDGVTNMYRCFYDCRSFNQSITIPNSVTNMGGCFYNCRNFNKSIVIPASVTNMSYCFYYCTSFNNSIYFLNDPNPNNCTNIFTGCKSVQLIPLAYSVDNILVPNQNYLPLYYMVNNYDNADVSTDICTDGEYIYSGNSIEVLDKTKTSYSAIPQRYSHPSGGSDKTINSLSGCFQNCINLTSAPSIPASVTNMDYCFFACKSLTTSPDMSNATNVTSMRYCFCNCISLTIPPNMNNVINVTNMNHCFDGCSSLTTTPDIPSSVTNISYCFYNCTALIIPSDISNATSVTNMNHCFEGCSSLTTAPEVPSSVTRMESCFKNCSSLTTASEIPNGVEWLTYCFDGCISLTTAPIIPASVTVMNYCFQNCINLTGIVEINSITLTSTNIFRNTTQLIILKGTYSQLSTIANQYSNVYAYSLSDTITGERDDDILDLVTLSVQVNRFKVGSNDDVLSAINVYKNNDSSTLSNLKWFTDNAANPQPDSTTWNQGEGWYLRNGNTPNYVFVEQNNKQLDTTKTYYKPLESFIMDESPKIFYTNIDSISEDEVTTFNIIVTDAYGEAATQYLTIPIAFYTMDVVKGGRVISFGQHATQDMLYKLLEEAPTDWLTDYNNYYQKDTSGNYIQLNEITVPSFETDTYYQLEYPNGLFNCRMGAKFIDMIVTNLIGEIKIYAGATVPDGWLECDGSELNVEDYPLLFSAIGNTYGGDGITTFYLPDLRGRFPIGMGLGTASDATSRTLGQTAGSERVTLKVNQIPAHTHDYQKPVLMYGSGGNAAWPGAGSSSTGSDQWGYSGVTSTGGGESHGNMPPYLAIKYIICAA